MHSFAPVLAVGTRMGCRTTARQMSRCLTEPPSSCRRLVFQGNVGLFDRLGSHRSKLEQAMAPGQDAGQGTSGWAPCRSGWRLTALRPRPGPRRDWQFGSFKVVTQLARGGPGTSARGHPSRPYQSHPSVRGAFDVARHRGPRLPQGESASGGPFKLGESHLQGTARSTVAYRARLLAPYEVGTGLTVVELRVRTQIEEAGCLLQGHTKRSDQSRFAFPTNLRVSHWH